jgi:hypothetical protein
MTLIPMLIFQFLANVGLYDKYIWMQILAFPLWIFNIYAGFKISKISYKKFKMQTVSS